MNDEAIATLKKNGTYLVPTLYLMDWQRENAAKANLPDFLQAKMKLVSGSGKAMPRRHLKRA